MGMSPELIDKVLGQRIHFNKESSPILSVIIDSRKVNPKSKQLFVALKGTMRDGHQFVEKARQSGCQNFVISDTRSLATVTDCNVWVVKDCLCALQTVAKAYRQESDLKVIGITGSNGKTTIKEWLAYFLSFNHNVCKSPGSYNSQIGVPLSMFEIQKDSEIGVFEAGLSKRGEMERLEEIIKPDIGIFTNIGEAHSGGFHDRHEKINEKLKLFKNVNQLIVCSDHKEIIEIVDKQGLTNKIRSWGSSSDSSLFRVVQIEKHPEHSSIVLEFGGKNYHFDAQISDSGSIENLFHCLATMLVLGIKINRAIVLSKGLFQIPMRLEMVHGSYDNSIINDAYNHDLTSLKNALDFLRNQSGEKRKVAVLSDIYESNMSAQELEQEIKSLVDQSNIDKVFWLGNQGRSFANRTFENKIDLETYLSEEFMSNSCILIKGARRFELDSLKNLFLEQNHSSSLIIDLAAYNHNLQRYSRELKKGVNIIAVIKAGAYGSGSKELARILENRGVAYLAVAFCDEAIELRKSGITSPIMILNSDPAGYSAFEKYHLEPVIYSIKQLKNFVAYCKKSKSQTPIHIKLDSGMNRLGFVDGEEETCAELINDAKLEVKTIFSHLAGSENPDEDSNTHKQAVRFSESYEKICTMLKYKPLRHLLNTGGIVRFPEYQFDLVRLGLGIYGIDTTGIIQNDLEKVHTLQARIIQIKNVKKGTKIGYNQKGTVHRDSKIAIVNIGYADGLPRLAGLGNYSFFYDGHKCPIIGQVCMDLTIIDITQVPEPDEGAIVEVFGKNNPIEILAKRTQTIPYEIISRISSRITKKWVLD